MNSSIYCRSTRGFVCISSTILIEGGKKLDCIGPKRMVSSYLFSVGLDERDSTVISLSTFAGVKQSRGIPGVTEKGPKIYKLIFLRSIIFDAIHNFACILACKGTGNSMVYLLLCFHKYLTVYASTW